MNRLGIFPSWFHSSQTKVTNFDSKVIIVEENVVALEITMDNIFRVQIAVEKRKYIDMISEKVAKPLSF